MAKTKKKKIEDFSFQAGDSLGWKYEVVASLGQGWEGEVYRISEKETKIERAAKFFYPHRNPHNSALKFYAKKLHKLRHCPILIHYHTQETVFVQDRMVSYLISDFVEGEMLSRYIARKPGGRLPAFEALHLLHGLASGMEPVHAAGEYHGDLHADNVMVERFGLGYRLKVLDLFSYGRSRAEHIRDDVCDLIRLFYDAIGGRHFYSKMPPEVKSLCCGLKRSLILKKFRSAGHLKRYLERMNWTR